jgi:hypothetical protein
MTTQDGGNPLLQWGKGRFLLLLVSLLGLIVLVPLLEGYVGIGILLDIFVTAVFIGGIYAVSRNRFTGSISIVLALPMFASTWAAHFWNSPLLVLTGDLFGIIFLAFALLSILTYVLQEQEVTADVIYGAIVVYLLMAIMWSFIYRVLETLHPDSFSFAQNAVGEKRTLFTYYSFVTITTLGYGDITPTTGVAKAFSVLEAVIGQIYLVVLVARLVGINISQSLDRKSGGD